MKMNIYGIALYTALLVNVSFAQAGEWPELGFPDGFEVAVVTDETWYAGVLPLRIYELTAAPNTVFARNAGPHRGALSSDALALLQWFADEWLRSGGSCLLNDTPMDKQHANRLLATLEAESATRNNQLSCIIDDHIVVLQFVPGLITTATVSLSSPLRVRVNVDATSLARAFDSHLSGATLLSADQGSVAGHESTTLAYTATGDPVFNAERLSASLQSSQWSVERPGKSLLSLPESQLMVATRGNERMQIAIQPASTGTFEATHNSMGSGIVVVIEKEFQ